jgi:hypothetical protein
MWRRKFAFPEEFSRKAINLGSKLNIEQGTAGK